GHQDVEFGAFVNPERVPQMAGSGDLFKQLEPSKTRLWALVPNRRGYEEALKAGVKNIAVFTAASETFNQKNINASIDESFQRFAEFVKEAKKLKMRVRGYVSTAFGCPYEKEIKPKAVLKITERLLKMKVDEISIG